MHRKGFVFTVMLVLAVACPRVLTAYTNPFLIDFNLSGDTAGWSDPINSPAGVFVAGETTPADSPAYSPTPNSAPGFNSTGWLRTGISTGGQANGISLAIYDGTAGGSTTDPTDYTIQGDVFVVTGGTQRNQEALVGRSTATDGNLPFQVFYVNNHPSEVNGYGYRGGGATQTYGLFPAETGNRWVRMRMIFHGATADIKIDRDIDGTWDYTQDAIALTATAGKAGFLSVINDPGTGNAIPDQNSYFDHFVYNDASEVADWMLF